MGEHFSSPPVTPPSANGVDFLSVIFINNV